MNMPATTACSGLRGEAGIVGRNHVVQGRQGHPCHHRLIEARGHGVLERRESQGLQVFLFKKENFPSVTGRDYNLNENAPRKAKIEERRKAHWFGNYRTQPPERDTTSRRKPNGRISERYQRLTKIRIYFKFPTTADVV